MIDKSDYRLPQEQEQHDPTEEERRQAEETIKELEKLPWRPHGDVW